MMMKKQVAIFVLCMLASVAVCGAERLTLTLADAMARARMSSVSAESALARLRSAYWEYRTYRAELLPEVQFGATVTSYQKQYSS